MRDLPAVALVFRLARGEQPLARLEPLAHERLVEPEQPHVQIVLPQQHAQHRASGAAVAQLHLVDDTDHAGRLTFDQLVERADARQVLVRAGKQEQQIAQDGHAQPGQLFRPVRPATFEKLHRRGQFERRGFFARGTHPGILRAARPKVAGRGREGLGSGEWGASQPAANGCRL